MKTQTTRHTEDLIDKLQAAVDSLDDYRHNHRHTPDAWMLADLGDAIDHAIRRLEKRLS